MRVGFPQRLSVMLAGLIIHWPPETFKQRYRTAFVALPLWAMGGVCVATVAAIYQTMTAEKLPSFTSNSDRCRVPHLCNQ